MEPLEPTEQHRGEWLTHAPQSQALNSRADAPSRSVPAGGSLPRAQILDVRARLRGMRTRQRVLAGRVPLHGEEVEAALIAEDVQLLGQVGAVSPAARSLSLTAREVEPTSRALAEGFPSRHLDRLRVHWMRSARPHAGAKGLSVAGLLTRSADARELVANQHDRNGRGDAAATRPSRGRRAVPSYEDVLAFMSPRSGVVGSAGCGTFGPKRPAAQKRG